jgi:hypothetical protein
VGFDPPDGKVDIAADGSTALEIAKSARLPNPHLMFSYLDGFTGRTHHLAGTYKLRLRIEAKAFNGGLLCDLEPISYDVHLNYTNALLLEIKNVERVCA